MAALLPGWTRSSSRIRSRLVMRASYVPAEVGTSASAKSCAPSSVWPRLRRTLIVDDGRVEQRQAEVR